MKNLLLVASVALFLCAGCSEQQKKNGKQAVKEVNQTIDYATGGTAVKAMKNSKTKVKDLNEQHNKQLEEAME